MRITVGRLSAAEFAVAAGGDWTVTPRWTDGARSLETTFDLGVLSGYWTI